MGHFLVPLTSESHGLAYFNSPHLESPAFLTLFLDKAGRKLSESRMFLHRKTELAITPGFINRPPENSIVIIFVKICNIRFMMSV